MLSLLKWIANLWLINNMIYPNTVFKRWQRQAIHSYQHGIYFSRALHSSSSWKGRNIIKMLVGYLVGWSCKNDEIMQKGVACVWPFMKLGESVTFISIQYVKLHILSWIFLSFTLKIFTPPVFSKNKWVPPNMLMGVMTEVPAFQIVHKKYNRSLSQLTEFYSNINSLAVGNVFTFMSVGHKFPFWGNLFQYNKSDKIPSMSAISTCSPLAFLSVTLLAGIT